MTMPEEEKMILHWIMQYEVMTMEQAIQLLHHKNRSTAQKVIRGLKKQHKISYVNGGVYIGAYPCSKPDPKVIDAIWIWMDSGGMWGGAQIASPDWNPLVCFVRAFSWNGLKGMGLLLAAIAGIYLYVKFHDKFTGEVRDPRGFTIS